MPIRKGCGREKAMRVVIYEWCCSGGLAGPDTAAVVGDDADAEPLAREGRAMFRALAADAVRDGGLEVAALVDPTLTIDLPAAVERIVVQPGDEVASLVAAARLADAVIVVAPETAAVLASRVSAVRAAGGRPIAPGDAFIRLAADKQATIDALAAAGVPVPAGRSLAAGEAWPDSFMRPSVRKARASAGCDGLLVVRPADPPPCPVAMPVRIEAWCTGTPVGVSCLVGPRGVIPVAALRQRFSAVAPVAYVGADLLEGVAERGRAEALARRTIEALLRRDHQPTTGWIGVDMILGARDDGLDDRVLEVNPRLTTSFVGLAAHARSSLVRAMLHVADGQAPDVHPPCDAFTFAIIDEPLPILR
ncbi:MAG: ATP-grasp domain-containing protein [Planctomycetaceae bacterium]